MTPEFEKAAEIEAQTPITAGHAPEWYVKATGLDQDIAAMNVHQARLELQRYRQLIRYIRDQKGDDNCVLDFKLLFGLLPEKVDADPQLPPKPLMMFNCSRYYDCKKEGKIYCPVDKVPENVTEADIFREIFVREDLQK
jgi:hypothetical protein